MKKKLSIIAAFLIVSFLSCKKESVSSDNMDKPDSWYQTKLESLVNLHAEASPDHPLITISGVNFGSYKEAYEAFKSLTKKQTFIDTVIASFKPKSTKAPLDNVGLPGKDLGPDFPTGGELYEYVWRTSRNIPIQNSLNPGTISLLVTLTYHILYIPGQFLGSIYDNVPSPVVVGYSGIGTIGNPTNAQIVFLQPDYMANTGQIAGQVLVTGTINKIPFSSTTTISGRWSYSIPAFTGSRASTVTYTIGASGGF